MLHTILWDWNGTLLDDVEVALAAMNEMLARRGLPLLQGREPYRDIFTFPVRVYYTAAGLDLSAEPFECRSILESPYHCASSSSATRRISASPPVNHAF